MKVILKILSTHVVSHALKTEKRREMFIQRSSKFSVAIGPTLGYVTNASLLMVLVTVESVELWTVLCYM